CCSCRQAHSKPSADLIACALEIEAGGLDRFISGCRLSQADSSASNRVQLCPMQRHVCRQRSRDWSLNARESLQFINAELRCIDVQLKWARVAEVPLVEP